MRGLHPNGGSVPLYRSPDEPAGVHDRFERLLGELGPVCGVDEAGRGPLAGPVAAAAVVLGPDAPSGLADSKVLTQQDREALFEAILSTCDVAVAFASARRVDAMNVRAATLWAMAQAVRGLPVRAAACLVDGNAVPDLPCPAYPLVKGDGRSRSIAAASIVAKVMRDRAMVRADASHPGYGLAGHKGYPTQAHRDALRARGASSLHRRSFASVPEG